MDRAEVNARSTLDERPEGFTVGYGGRVPAEFTTLLMDAGVKTIVDVRIRPDKAALGSYAMAKDAEKGISGLLARSGIGYISLPELGNLFLAYDDWPVRYEKFLELAGPLLFDRLAGIPGPVCLLCAEKRVSECHRGLIAAYLERTSDWRFQHLE